MTGDLLGFLYNYSDKIIELGRSMHGSCVRKMNKRKTNYRLVLSSYFARAFEIFESVLLLVKQDIITLPDLSISNFLVRQIRTITYLYSSLKPKVWTFHSVSSLPPNKLKFYSLRSVNTDQYNI